MINTKIQKINLIRLLKKNRRNLDSFDNWLLKTFSVPLYDKDGKFQGFSINEGSQFGIGPSWIDSRLT
ncbi:hypothetical protein [Mycoplasmopsis cynos]|uniref:hypothetical protein n=1 Tax=Mycoplasmopsis cynos TaxID=171284 RepID=UPI0022054C54|nr:hypothetical protein [Mycoplasmopsis cynos]UWV92392.1 hypothetical protein NWE57_06060 [Mycoplasmopsis cynos]